MRQVRRAMASRKRVTPAHLCQEKNFNFSGDRGRSAIYRPNEKVPTMTTVISQCREIAVRVYLFMTGVTVEMLGISASCSSRFRQCHRNEIVWCETGRNPELIVTNTATKMHRRLDLHGY